MKPNKNIRVLPHVPKCIRAAFREFDPPQTDQMLRFWNFFGAFLLVAIVPVVAQTATEYPEDSPNWLPMGDAVASAKGDGDIILIHAYAPWCGWCRELDATTYTNDAVQEYLSEHFEVTRLDIESEQSVDFFGGQVPMKELGLAFSIRSTPTTLFMDADGNYLTYAPSYIPPDRFLIVLRYVVERAFEMMEFDDYLEMIQASEG